jgi:aminopeptidase N
VLRDALVGCTFAEEVHRLITALGRAREPSLLQQSLALAFGDAPVVRKGDLAYLAGSMGATRAGRTVLWTHITNNWSKLFAMFADTGFILAGFLGGALAGYTTQEDADTVRAFFKTSACPAAERVIAQSLEKIEQSAARLARESDAVGKWLKARSKL